MPVEHTNTAQEVVENPKPSLKLLKVDHTELERRIKEKREKGIHIELSPDFYEFYPWPIRPIPIKLITPENPHPKVPTAVFPIPDEAITAAENNRHFLALSVGRSPKGQLTSEPSPINIDLVAPSIFEDLEKSEQEILPAKKDGKEPLINGDIYYTVALKSPLVVRRLLELWTRASVVHAIFAFAFGRVMVMDISRNGTFPLRQLASPDKDSLVASKVLPSWDFPSFVQLRPGEMVTIDVGKIEGNKLVDPGWGMCFGHPEANVIRAVELPFDCTDGKAHFGIVDGEAKKL